MVCDIVFTSPRARWGFPEIKLGCFPPVACAGLAGSGRTEHAADLILTGRQIDGTEAAAIVSPTKRSEPAKSAPRNSPGRSRT